MNEQMNRDGQFGKIVCREGKNTHAEHWVSDNQDWLQTHYIDKDDPELLTLLSLAPKCWDYMHHHALVYIVLEIKPRTSHT